MYKLRDYQQRSYDATKKFLDESLEKKKKKSNRPYSGVVVAPTAHGKSLEIAKLSLESPTNTIVMCPSKEILEQNFNKFIGYGGEGTIYSASLGKKEISKTIFATPGSVKNLGPTLKEMGEFIVIQDECHLFSNARGGMFKDFLKDLSPKAVIGYTATPFTLSTKGDASGFYSQLTMLNRTSPSIYDDIIHVTQIHELTAKGFWAKTSIFLDDYDSSGLILNKSGTEFTQESVESSAKINNVNNKIYIGLKRLLREGKESILVFLDSVENCYIMAAQFSEIAGVVEAKTKKKEREKLVNDFKNKKIKIMCCVSTLSVGFDFPELEVVILGRPTNSLAVFYQMYGRLIRPFQNPEKVGLFYDYGGNIQRFGTLETLTVENYNTFGWGVFNNNALLTGKPLNGPPIYKHNLDSMTRGRLYGYRPSNKEVFEFGKYKNKPLKDIPIHYLSWACENAQQNMSKPLYDKCLQLIVKAT